MAGPDVAKPRQAKKKYRKILWSEGPHVNVEQLKAPQRAVIAGGKATVKAATTGAKGVVKGKGVATKTAGGMAKKAAGWIKRQGFVPTIR